MQISRVGVEEPPPDPFFFCLFLMKRRKSWLTCLPELWWSPAAGKESEAGQQGWP